MEPGNVALRCSRCCCLAAARLACWCDLQQSSSLTQPSCKAVPSSSYSRSTSALLCCCNSNRHPSQLLLLLLLLLSVGCLWPTTYA
jgi:hypothetical protein